MRIKLSLLAYTLNFKSHQWIFQTIVIIQKEAQMCDNNDSIQDKSFNDFLCLVMLLPNHLLRQPVVIYNSSHNPSSSTVYVPVVHPLLTISILFRCASPVVNWISLKHHLSSWFSSRFSVCALLAVVLSWDVQREKVFLIHSASIKLINFLFLMTQSNVVKKPLSASTIFS